MKKLALGAIVFAAMLSAAIAVQAAAPYDIQRYWAADAINTFIEYGVINYGENDRFRPEDDITRAEAAQIFMDFIRVMGADGLLGTDKTDSVYVELWDVPEDRQDYDAVCYCVRNDMIRTVDGVRFKPDEFLTREDFAHMLNSYTSVKWPYWTAENWYIDVQGSYACLEIEKLCTAGVLSGYDDGTYRPYDWVSRTDFICALYSITEGWEKKPVEVTLPQSNIIDVPYISQVYPVYAPVGCEPTSLLMALKAKGYAADVDLRTFLDELPKTGSNPAKGFVGSPYVADKTKKTRTTIYPAPLAEYGRRYGDCEDFSDKSVNLIQAELLHGNPVVVYVTLWWEKPYYRWYNIEGEMQYLLSNNHALLLCGYDSVNNSYYVADPYNVNNRYSEYKYWQSGDLVNSLYYERCDAVVVR